MTERASRRAAGRVAITTQLEPTLVRGDPERVGRAVSNLVDNAIEWSPHGSVIEVGLSAGP